MIAGVELRPLTPYPDDRGAFTEVFRQEWTGFEPVQWSFIHSTAGSLRAMHCHAAKTDWKVMAGGEVFYGLKDLRSGSPTEGEVMTLTATDAGTALVIPPGVAHGLLFLQDSVMLTGADRYWSADRPDDFACRWDDPQLGIDWPMEPTLISDRDLHAGTYGDLLAWLEPFQPIAVPQ